MNMIQFPGSADRMSEEQHFLQEMKNQITQIAEQAGINELVKVDLDSARIHLMVDNLPADILYPYLCYGCQLIVGKHYQIFSREDRHLATCRIVESDRPGMIGYNLQMTYPDAVPIVSVDLNLGDQHDS